jgi:N-acetylmuramic acid 6-phosphate etherase
MQSAKKLVLGIEGGGTKTEWVLVAMPGNETVRRGSLPAANLKLTTDAALARIFKALPQNATHVGAFLAGCATESDRARLRAIVKQAWPRAEIAIGSDRDSGFATAFGGGDGIAVISGTGSAVSGRKGARIEKAGGWGQLLGDKGGGYNIAVHGLRHTLSCYDLDRKNTPLGEKILHALSLGRLQDLVDWAANADKMSVAKLVPVMFGAAAEGDAEMRAIIESGAHILADYTAAVARRLKLAAPDVRLLGGLFENYASYVDFFKKRLDEILPGARTEVCRKSGADGAAWLAAKENGGAPIFKRASVSDDELAELRTAITEQPNPGSSHLDQLTTAEIVDLFVTEEKNVADAIAACREKICAAVELVDAALQNGGRLFYIGAGTSGRLGVLDASEIPPTFGASPELVQGIIAGGFEALYKAVEGAEDHDDDGKFSIIERGVKHGDVVCGITASGRTPFVLGALREAKKIGAKTILLTCNPARSRSGTGFDAEIDLPTGPEIVTGSTRLKAGTATKLALNILSTCAMIRLGKINGNLMSNLRATNVKLRDRAVRLVAKARGLTYAQALGELEKSGWSVRDCLPPDSSTPA